MTHATAKIGTMWQPVTVLRTKGDRVRVRDRDGRERSLSSRNVRMPEAPPRSSTVARPSTTRRPATKARPKPPKPTRSRGYMDWVKTHPCCNPRCQAPPPSDPDHYPPTAYGRKCDDHAVAPLCRRCHEARTRTQTLPGLDRRETREIMLRAQRDLLIAWFVRGEGGEG